MGSLYFTPVTAILFGLSAGSWLIFIGWVGWRWLMHTWHLPWPAVAIIQGILAAQIYWLFWLMALNNHFPPTFLAWLQIPGSLLFWLAVLPWFILSNLLPLAPLANRLGMHFYPGLVDMIVDYALFFATINVLHSYLNSRRKQVPYHTL